MNSKEQRKGQRQQCLVPVEGKPGTVFERLKTVDISPGGVGLVSSRKIPVNKKIAMEVVFSERADPVLAVGKVRWVRRVHDGNRYRIGVCFNKVLAETGVLTKT